VYVLDKRDALNLPAVFQVAEPLAALTIAAVAGATWRFSVRHYRSSGS
jgi:ABC-2 type transport system permease protein